MTIPPIFSSKGNQNSVQKMPTFSQILSALHLLVCVTLIILSICNAPMSAAPYPSTSNNHGDYYLLNCGLPTATATSSDNQTWYRDDNSTFAPPVALAAATIAAWALGTNPSTPNQVPCGAARIFNSSFTYSFPVTPGPKFIRLYFCPVNYNSIPNSQFYLNLQADGGAGPFTLLHNFSAYLYHQHDGPSLFSVGMVFQEYLLMVNTSLLNLTFFPTSPGSLAFVNGIEIVSVPDGLYFGDYQGNPSQSPCGPVTSVPTSQLSIQGPVALQTVARLNVGGGDVAAHGDSGGMLRTWFNDENFVAGNFHGAVRGKTPRMKIKYTPSVPAYTAPDAVYLTARVMGPYNETIKMSNNLTWGISVDPGFDYLVRLHFCEIDPNITGDNQRVFNIYINNQTAQRQADVMAWTNDITYSPVCKDYVVTANGGGNGSDAAVGNFVPLLLTLYPDIEGKPREQDVILNGLEVFKVSLWNRSLAVPNPTPTGDDVSPNQQNTPATRSHSSSHILPIIIGSVLGGVALSLLVISAIYWLRVRSKAARNPTKLGSKDGSGESKAISSNVSSLPSHLCKRFTFHQIKVATRNFDEKAVIGVGGFGKVYKGSMPVDGEPTSSATTTVAIKRLNPSSNQGALEFRTEIEMLTKLRHVHLVSLIGYCNDDQEMILVYEYMSRGTLRDHLYARTRCSMDQDPDNPPLPWKERLKICIGAAHGLHYLHGGAKHPIIHRDVKTTNILLDEKWTAKVSDFGLCKVGSKVGDHVSTQVKGSVGYLDPEYHRLQQLTDKSDVYSFGVVLFEVLCGRPAMNAILPKEEVNLARWARGHYQSGTLDSIVDPNLIGEIAPECLRKFGEVAEMCVRNEGIERPSMGDVVWGLELALQLQLTAKNNEDHNLYGGPGQVQDQGDGEGRAEGQIGGLNNVDNGGIGATACHGTHSEEALYQSSDTGSLTTKSDIDCHMRSDNVFSEIVRPQGR